LHKSNVWANSLMLHVTNTDSFKNIYKWLIALHAEALSYSLLYVCAVISKSNKRKEQQTDNETKQLLYTSIIRITDSWYCYVSSTCLNPHNNSNNPLRACLYCPRPLTCFRRIGIHPCLQRGWERKLCNHWSSQLHVTLSSVLSAALFGFPGDVGQPLEGTPQTSAICPRGVEILVIIVLLKFLYNRNAASEICH
jgi:hypothetical protein